MAKLSSPSPQPRRVNPVKLVMKTLPVSLLLGALVFAACQQKPTAEPAPAPVPAPVRAAVVPDNPPAPSPAARPSLEARIVEWKLHPAEMQDEMDHERRVTRLRLPTEPLPQYARSEAMETCLTQRLHDGPVLGDNGIRVNVERVVATLVGQADALEQVGRAIAVTLDTPGISEVISELELPAKDVPADAAPGAFPPG
jgi:hypothetical protein